MPTTSALSRRSLLLFSAAVACNRASGGSAEPEKAGTPTASSSDDPWPADRIMATDGLAKRLGSDAGALPVLMHVGPAVLFKKSHLPGAVHPGEGGDPDGLVAIATYAAVIPKGREVVLYCGCCPWDHCPNIRPAFKRLTALGFTDVHVLDLPKTLQANWIDRGFPVET